MYDVQSETDGRPHFCSTNGGRAWYRRGDKQRQIKHTAKSPPWPISVVPAPLFLASYPSLNLYTAVLLHDPIVILPPFRHLLPAVHQRDKHILQPVAIPESPGNIPSNPTSTTTAAAAKLPAKAAAAVPAAASASAAAAVQLPAGLPTAASWLPTAEHLPAAAAATVPAAASASS